MEAKTTLLALLGRHHWTEIAQFGNFWLVLPAAALVALVMVAGARRREALTWSAAILLCTVVTLALKSVFGDFTLTLFGHPFRARNFPSGHVALATVFYGGLAWLAWSSGTLLSRAIALALTALVASVALAVIVIGWHHTLDIVVGAGLGLGAILAARRLLRRPSASAG
jgi:membrane-associated phospholipid phosphatase